MRVNLGLHLGFSTTRFANIKLLSKIINEELGIQHVQYVSDIINPFLPKEIIKDKSYELKSIFDKYNIISKHSFTSSRHPYFADRDKNIRNQWLKWFDNFFLTSSILQCEGAGSILSILDFEQMKNYKKNLGQILFYWRKLSRIAQKRKLKYLMWEPMSIPREFGDTIQNTKKINHLINDNSPIPILPNLDVDHGNHLSGNKKDSDPYEWLKKFCSISPSIHIKQKTRNVFGHKPFTKENNKKGIIKPKKVVDILKKYNKKSIKEYYLYFEFSFREREPFDSKSIKDIRESIKYWKKYLK